MLSYLRTLIKKQNNTIKVSNLLNQFKDMDSYQIKVKGSSVCYDTTDDFSKLWYHAASRPTEYHEPHLSNQFISHLKKGDIVFDVGCLIGYFTCLASELVGEEGSVHAFEIDKNCLPLIEKSIALNNYKNITVNNLAVCDHNGEQSITQFDRLRLGEMLLTKNKKNTVKVKATTIDQYIVNCGLVPDLVKIDVEGSEMLVLNGMHQLLLKGKTRLLIEIHVRKLHQFYSIHYKELIQFLVDMNYQIELIPEEESCKAEKVIVDSNTLLEDNALIYGYPREIKD
jgi:FkbM family methyltransferase